MQTRRFLNKHGFIVLGTPFRRDPGFTTCSEIKETVGLIESRQGGSLYSSKSPGLVTVPAVTLSRPATAYFGDLLSWFRLVADGSYELHRSVGGGIGRGAPWGRFYKYDIDVVQIDRAYGLIQAWRLKNAFPTEVTPSDGQDANAEERVMESIVLQPEYIEAIEISSSGVRLAAFFDTPLGSLTYRSGQGTDFNFGNINDIYDFISE